MMSIPYSVSSCLYSGISDRIAFIKRELGNPLSAALSSDNLYLRRYYNEVVEAVNFYVEHCIVSGKYLKDALEEIKPYFE